ncbi:hypothetical protein AVEN_86920-1 [Araneus ventricosus]|uniref:Uncharacterized protein n=1 Tax=Araneus ventricosus TaxID=182803 RepID=A0A4Y2QV41_ARAVE|nr:hypothetical protein AVEN_86920-1 [Araneus ventricosus]
MMKNAFTLKRLASLKLNQPTCKRFHLEDKEPTAVFCLGKDNNEDSTKKCPGVKGWRSDSMEHLPDTVWFEGRAQKIYFFNDPTDQSKQSGRNTRES